MVLRHNDSRRRRLVVDPNQHDGDVIGFTAEKPATRRKKKLYRPGADRRSQWKTTDLIPKRPWVIAVFIGLLLSSLIVLNLFSFYSEKWVEYLGVRGTAALKLSGQATLANWFSSFLLIISGFASLQIYALRQHRQDDYRGSYRLWLWMSGVLLLASVNCVVDLTEIATQLLHSLTKLSLAKSLLGVLVIKLALLSVIVARGSLEVRESRWSLSLVVLVWCAYGAAMVLRLPVLQPVMANLDESNVQVTCGNLLLVGTFAVLIAHLVFVRFVYLQALGIIKPTTNQSKTLRKKKTSNSGRVKKKLTRRKTPPSEVAEKAKSAAPSTATPSVKLPQKENDPPPVSKAAPNLRPTSAAGRQEESPADSVIKLSKAEQRRQRKQQPPSHRRAA